MVNVLVVTHGEFGAYLVEAAESIVGAQGDAVRSVGISPRLSMEEVRRRIEKDVRELCSDGGLIVLTDMPGGTPSNISLPACKDLCRVAVVSGVNLYMMVTAFSFRKTDTLEELTEKVISSGRRAILDIKTVFMAKA